MGRLEEAAILVGGRTQLQLEWVHPGAQTQTSHFDLNPDDVLEQGRQAEQGVNIAGFVAQALRLCRFSWSARRARKPMGAVTLKPRTWRSSSDSPAQ